MKKLVYINQSANYLSEGIVNAMLANGGYDEVVLLIGNPANVRFDSPKVKIDPICSYNRSSFLRRAKSWLVGSAQIQWKLWTRYRRHDVFLVSNPPTAAFCMALCRNRYKSLIYDIYPDGLVSGGFMSEKNPLIRLWQAYNRRFFKNADRVFTITDGMADRLSRYIDRNKIEVIPIWYNPSLQRIPKESNLFIKKHNLEGKFIVMYSGNIGKGHNVKLLPEIANKLHKYDHIKFVIIGEGWEKQEIISRVSELSLTNILILPYQPIESISHSLSAADLNYISVEKKASTVCVPSKTYNCLFVGSPVLCISEPTGELSKMINRYGIGRVYQEWQIEQIVEYIKQISIDSNQLNILKDKVISLSDKYSQKQAERFI